VKRKGSRVTGNQGVGIRIAGEQDGSAKGTRAQGNPPRTDKSEANTNHQNTKFTTSHGRSIACSVSRIAWSRFGHEKAQKVSASTAYSARSIIVLLINQKDYEHFNKQGERLVRFDVIR